MTANNVLEVPLHGVNPALQIEPVLNRIAVIGVVDGGIHRVLHVIVSDDHREDLVTLLSKSHFSVSI